MIRWQSFLDSRLIVFFACFFILLSFYVLLLSRDLSLKRSLQVRRQTLLQNYAVKYKSKHHFSLLVHKVSDVDYLLRVLNVMQSRTSKKTVINFLSSLAKKHFLHINFIRAGFVSSGKVDNKMQVGFNFSGSFSDVYRFLLAVSRADFLINMKKISIYLNAKDGLVHLVGSWEVLFDEG